MKPFTKKLQRLHAQYLRQLKRCGFRSWKAANKRRVDLIMAGVDSPELAPLQRLADLYVRWKTNDETRVEIRRLSRWIKRLEAEHSS